MDKAQENDITCPKEANSRSTVEIESSNLQEHIDADTVELETLVTRQALYEDSAQIFSEIGNDTTSIANTVIKVQEAHYVIKELGDFNIHETSIGCDNTNPVNYARNDAGKRTNIIFKQRKEELVRDKLRSMYLFLERHINYKYFAASLGIHVLFGIFIFAYEFDSKYKYCNDTSLEHFYIVSTIVILVIGTLHKLLDIKGLWLIFSCLKLNLATTAMFFFTVLAMTKGIYPKNTHADPNNYYCKGFLFWYEAVENNQ